MAEEFSARNLYLLFLLFKFVTRETKEFSAGNLYLLFLLFKFVTRETKELFFFSRFNVLLVGTLISIGDFSVSIASDTHTVHADLTSRFKPEQQKQH